MALRAGLRARIAALKLDALTLWVAARDPRTPVTAKVLAGLVAAYAFSPIDLIPDVIPVLGLLDDLIIVPIGIWVALRLIPRPLLEEYRVRASELAERPVSRAGAVAIALVWIASAALIAWAVLR